MLEAQEEQQKKEQRVEERKSRLSRACLEGTVTDEDFARIVRDRLYDTKSIQVVRGWLKGNLSYLGLLGKSGCGKTVACAWALAQGGGRYITAKKLERMFLAQFGHALDDQDMLMQYPGLLVVDDIGTELKRDEFTSSLYEVFNARQGAGRRTIFTANLTRQEFETRYSDPRLLSRLKRADFVGDAGPDLRERNE